MKRVLFYTPKGSLFEATEYYVNLMVKAFIDLDYIIEFTSDLSEVTSSDYLVTIRPYDAAHILIKPKRHIHWFQGIAPEEKVMQENFLKGHFYGYLNRRWEKKALDVADLCFFVSDKMVEHYEHKYRTIVSHKSIVMPCYNILLDCECFTEDRYKQNNFVYAGGLNKWQCIEELLEIYRIIEANDNSASLSILTSDIVKANSIVKAFNLERVTVGFVPLELLQEELKKYKYGFLLREDNIVNNVASPTKMNSYLAAGVIPIYTPFISSFEKNINLGDFCIKLSNFKNYSLSANIILNKSKEQLDLENMKYTFETIFNDFYNDSFYINKIKENIKRL